jgi:hypothetical protein
VDTDPLDRIEHAVVIKPGDRVLLTLCDANLSHANAHDMRDRLAERFPGAEFTFIAGITGIAIAEHEEQG